MSEKKEVRFTAYGEDGRPIHVYDDTEIKCEIHNVTVKYGDISPIAQIAVEACICSAEHLPCIMLS